LADGAAAFVPRAGATPAEVIARVHEAGGIASLAHPALVKRDEWIPDLVESGLDALEAYHSEHDADDTARYLAAAQRFGLAVSGGSDYHGDTDHDVVPLGGISLPREHFERLAQRARSASKAT